MRGPTITILPSCSNCNYLNYDYFNADNQWNHKRRCFHPDIVDEPLSLKHHATPPWCPLLNKVLDEAMDNLKQEMFGVKD